MKRIIIGNKLSGCHIEVGKKHTTKINVIVGANSEEQIELELKKIEAAANLGVHTIIDLSIVRTQPALWQLGRERFPELAFGKVAPILVAVDNDGDVTPEELWKEIEWSVMAGVDYMTLNLIPMKLSDFEVVADRAYPTTSRQGGVLLKYMMRNQTDNPYGPILDEILALFREYNVTMHIGSTFRPSGITEAFDRAHRWELDRQMEMYQRVNEAGVQAIVEPISHQPLKDIGPCIDRLRKDFGEYVPFQMLGPIVTEVNFECDHYASAPGAAVAAMYNVGKITTIPPREHVGFPDLQDTVSGIKATLTSVQAGDLCRLPELMERDQHILEERVRRQSCNQHARQRGCNKCQEFCPLMVQHPACMLERTSRECQTEKRRKKWTSRTSATADRASTRKPSTIDRESLSRMPVPSARRRNLADTAPRSSTGRTTQAGVGEPIEREDY